MQFASVYQKQLSYALCVLVAVALVIFGYRFFAKRSETKAFAELAQIMASYEVDKKASSAQEAYRKASEELQRLIKRNGGNAGGKLARVRYANISYDAGDYDKAIKLYKQSLNDFKDNPLVYHLILSDLGYAYEGTKDDRDAATYFEELSSATDSGIRDEALFNLGLLYERLGDAARSRKAFQEIVSKYPNSMYFDIAQEKLSSKSFDSSS
ncbi:MAG: tetratricopeptide repeat protein [Desulfobacterales bacterium]